MEQENAVKYYEGKNNIVFKIERHMKLENTGNYIYWVKKYHVSLLNKNQPEPSHANSVVAKSHDEAFKNSGFKEIY